MNTAQEALKFRGVSAICTAQSLKSKLNHSGALVDRTASEAF